MGFKYWLSRAVKVFLSVAVVFFIAELTKDTSIVDALIVALTWSSLMTVMFVGAMFTQTKKAAQPAAKTDK